MKKLLSASITATVMASAMAVAPAQAEVSASAGVSNMYFWRGQDLGAGAPQISADLTYSVGGAYIGTWIASGDTAFKNEYDLGAGYAGEAGDFSYDVSVWTYMYSNDDTSEGNASEFVGSLGFGPVSFGLIKNITGKLGSGNTEKESDVMDTYITLGTSFGDFSATYGIASFVGENQDYSHVVLGYAYSEELSFGVSQVVDADQEDFGQSDLKVFFNYSLPLK